MDALKQQVLNELGIVRWQVKQGGLQSLETAEFQSEPQQEREESPAAQDSWQALQESVASCQQCSLAHTRKNTVFGSGSITADWMFIGEAPGAEEDRQGLPFVGRAGQLLTAMISALGLERDQVFIANVLKCRPPDNRDPLGEEVVKCTPFLARQINRIQPRMIVSLGRFAAQALLQSTLPIGKLRGVVHHYEHNEIPLVATYHPAYLLRSPLEKRKAWQDLLLAKDTYNAREQV